MAYDATESIRRELVAAINTDPDPRKELEGKYGQVWDTQEMQTDFDVLGFAAPYIVVARKSDQKRGSLMFQHRPRLYFGWKED